MPHFSNLKLRNLMHSNEHFFLQLTIDHDSVKKRDSMPIFKHQMQMKNKKKEE